MATESSTTADPCRIYIGNLNKDSTDEAIRGVFAECGAIVTLDIAASRTFGWATFSSAEGASAALFKNGVELDDYALRVEPHKPRARVDTDAEEHRGDPLRVFVGQLPRDYPEADLTALFPGGVSNVRFFDRGAIRNAYVTFESEEAATAALAANGTVLAGNPIRVEPERRRVRRRGGEGRRGGAGGESKSDEPRPDPVPGNPRRVFVGNIPRELDSAVLATHFGGCGAIASVKALRRGIGYVTFEDEASVAAAVALTGTSIEGREINVQPEMRRPRRRKPRSNAGAGAGAGAGGRRGGAGRRRTAGSGDEAEPTPPNTVWVAGLPTGTDEEAVTAAMSAFGDVTKVNFGRTRVFAYVSFADESGATDAVAAEGLQIGGEDVKVEVANPTRGPAPADPCRVYIANTPPSATEDNLRQFLASAGNPATIELKNGFAYAVFGTPEEAAAATSIEGTINENDIHVEMARGGRRRRRRRAD